ncbi:MAG: metallophosphatase [Oligoflexia bacterium]|nr:metallophosphatase [Oligoflexia bacterium]
MRTLFVGDVHGCAAELGELLAQAQADRVVLLGDLFAKGPDPRGVWSLIESHGCQAVMGNHDQRVLDRAGTAHGLSLPPSCLDWLAALPMSIQGVSHSGLQWLAIHAGVHPESGLAGTSRERALAMRRFPDDRDLDNPFWWELWSGPPLVLYGHDAVRGLVDRRPHSLGLDTGCVYGGRLTGYLLEEHHLLSVHAHGVWRRVPAVAPRG